MANRRRLGFVLGTVAVLVVAIVAWRVVPLFTGPAMPLGATRLTIATESAPALGCMQALLLPARVSTSGDALVLVGVDSGAIVDVVWPAGFRAWRLGGRAILADPSGGIVGMDGDVLSGLGGGNGSDDRFHICPFGIPTRPG